ncbi:MAG: NFACT family protein, partial [Candidatus Korarchaeota archaeon]|nr:NFACT family protein [Candidatus Korarchaeota archaeon]
ARRRAEEYRDEAEHLRRLANKASQSILVLEEKIECARRGRDEEGWRGIPEACGVLRVEPARGLIYVDLGGEEMPLDIRLSADKNVVALYRRAGELESKARRAEEVLGSMEEKLEELRRRRVLGKLREKIRARPKEWYEKYHWTISTEGYLIIGGRNIDQNESLVRRYLGPRDIFMHADIRGAPVIVVKTGGREPGEKTLMEAAALAASYSRAWREGLASIDVYWAWGEQVSKSPPPGEYLSKGSFMVYGKRNYIRGVPLRLALGVEDHAGYPRIVVGREETVAQRARIYAVLAPGSLKPGEAAEKILRGLARLDSSYGLVLEALGADEIVERIPGPSRIVSIRRGKKAGSRRGD